MINRQTMVPLIFQPVHKRFNTNMKFMLWSLDFSVHPCKSSKSVQLDPALPENFPATNSTTSFVISTGTKTGVASYAYNVIPTFFS